MEPASAIVAALGFGAATLAKGALGAAAKDAYEALKNAVLEFVSAGDIDALEKKSASDDRKTVVAEALAEAGKADDRELARLAAALIEALKAQGAAGAATGVSLEDVEAVNIRLRNITATGTGASLKEVKAAGDIEITDVKAGEPPGKT
jgi:hypothetical protein